MNYYGGGIIVVKLIFKIEGAIDKSYVYNYSGTVFNVNEVITFTEPMEGYFYWKVVNIIHQATAVNHTDELIEESNKLVVLKPFADYE